MQRGVLQIEIVFRPDKNYDIFGLAAPDGKVAVPMLSAIKSSGLKSLGYVNLFSMILRFFILSASNAYDRIVLLLPLSRGPMTFQCCRNNFTKYGRIEQLLSHYR